MAKARDVLAYSTEQRLNQGTLFTCGVAVDYVGCVVHGIIITARCDVVNDKIRVYNYLPVVRVDDWLHRDGRVVLTNRLIADVTNGLRNLLRENQYSLSVLETETPRSILDGLFGPTNGREHKHRLKVEKLCEQHDIAVRALLSAPAELACLEVAEAVPKLRDAVLKELVSQSLSGYYFLSCVEPQGDDKGYVVLLREVQTMSREVAAAVAEGIDAQQLAASSTLASTRRVALDIGPDEIAMPIAALQPPHIEHLMQTFSTIFTRIGLPNIDAAYVANLWDRQPSISQGVSR